MDARKYQSELETLRRILLKTTENIEEALQSGEDAALLMQQGATKVAHNAHLAFIEAIDKLLGNWQPSETIESLGWDERELLEKLFYAISNGISNLQSRYSHLVNRANNVCHVQDRAVSISTCDRSMEKVHSVEEGAAVIGRYMAQAAACNTFCQSLLRLKLEIINELPHLQDKE